MGRRLANLLLVNTRLCLTEVYSNKTRSLISSFGIFLGVASLLALLSFMRAMDKDVTETIVTMGGLDIIEIQRLDPQTPQEAMEYRRSPGLRLSQAERLGREVPGIAMALPEASGAGSRISFAGRNTRAQSLAISEHHFDLFNYQLGAGRKFTPSDFSMNRKVCLIGGQVAERLFERDESAALGKKLNLSGVSFEIIGTIHTETRWDERARMVIYPFSTYAKYIGGTDPKLASIKLKVERVKDLSRIKAGVTAALAAMHRGVHDFDIVLNEDKIREMQATGKALTILLVVIATLSLLTGGISIMNIMFAVIGDRIREIGVRKALGARRGDLFMQFLIESVLLCLVGATPGVVAGAIPAMLPAHWLPMDPFLTPADYFLGLGFALSVGFFAGLFPALKAANMKPIEALQYV